MLDVRSRIQRVDRDIKTRWIVNGSVILFFVTGCPFFWLFIKDAHESSFRFNCASNLKELHQAMVAYGADNNDVYPEASRWMDRLRAASDHPDSFQDMFRCVSVQLATHRKDAFGYAFNDRLKGKIDYGAYLSTTPEMFDSKQTQWNAHGGLELLPNPPRHRGNVVIYTDGHTKQLRAGENGR